MLLSVGEVLDAEDFKFPAFLLDVTWVQCRRVTPQASARTG